MKRKMAGRFNHMLGEGKEVVLGDETFICKPLSARYITAIAGTDEEDKDELIFKLVTATLQQTDATIKIDDVKELPIGAFRKLSEVITELNALNEE